MKNRSKTVAFLGVCTALALILAYLEILLQPLFPTLPGIKMGLPNIVIVFLLYRRGIGAAVGVSFLRILLVTMLFGNAMAFFFSVAGAFLSLLLMIILRRMSFLSTVGVSVAGAVAHNIGQILTAMLVLETVELGYYLVILTVSGTVAGIVIGLAGAMLIKKIPQKIV
ncbi:MAG: Gx transporter family protein [Clostridia bacterium]|nr:Gx transporter family protein [Clostridia bacterium]MBR6795278.1 Gx transporter family protein [Clostridia bacterium]